MIVPAAGPRNLFEPPSMIMKIAFARDRPEGEFRISAGHEQAR